MKSNMLCPQKEICLEPEQIRLVCGSYVFYKIQFDWHIVNAQHM